MDKWSFQLGNKPTGSEHVQRRISGESVSHSDCIAKGVASSESISFLLCESLFLLPLASHIHKHMFPFGIGWRTDSSTVQAWKTSRRDSSFPQVHIRLRWPEHQGFWRTMEIPPSSGSCTRNTELLFSKHPLLSLLVFSLLEPLEESEQHMPLLF